MSHILPRFTQPAIHHDPLAILLAQREAAAEAARADIAAGRPLGGEPAALRGIPCIANGIGGTSPGTDPLRETIRRNTPRR